MPTSDVPTEAECSREEFLVSLRERLSPILALSGFVKDGARRNLSRRVYSLLAEEARALESHLDEHGAWSNSSFVGLVELVATVRGAAIVGFTLKHILERLQREEDGSPEGALRRDFEEATIETRGFVDGSLSRLMEEIRATAESLYGDDLPDVTGGVLSPVSQEIKQRLPADLMPFTPTDRKRNVVAIAARFLVHKKSLENQSSQRVFDDTEEMRRYVIEVCNEEECRFFETRIQNLLARYESCIKGSALESEDRDLQRISAYMGFVRQLSRVLTELVHFYERHETGIRGEALTSRVLDLMDRDVVLDRALNYALYYIHEFMNGAEPHVQNVLDRYTRHESLTLTIPDGLQLHIRPVSLIAKIVEHHKTPVNVIVGDTSCYAGSIVQVLMAIGAQPDARSVTFEGDQKALRHIALLFEHGLGEDGHEHLPEELAYLRG